MIYKRSKYRLKHIKWVLITMVLTCLTDLIIFSFFSLPNNPIHYFERTINVFENEIYQNKSQFYNSSFNRSWDEIIIPTSSSLSNNFKYKYLLQGNQIPLNRSYFSYEFLRLFKIDPYDPSSAFPHTLIFGAHTSIGSALSKIIRSSPHKYWHELQQDNEVFFDYSHEVLTNPVIEINGLDDLIFSNEILNSLFTLVNISCIYAFPQALQKGIDSSEGAHFFTKEIFTAMTLLSNFSKFYKIPMTIGIMPPYHYEFSTFFQCFSTNVVYISNIADFGPNSNYDFKNPLRRIYQECEKYGKSSFSIFENTSISSLTSYDAASFLDYLTNSKSSFHFDYENHLNLPIFLSGYKEESLENVISYLKNSKNEILSEKCDISIKYIPNYFRVLKFNQSTSNLNNLNDTNSIYKHIKIGNSFETVQSIIENNTQYFYESFFLNNQNMKPYLSIIASVRNSNQTDSSQYVNYTQEFLNRINRYHLRNPLLDFEVILVDNPKTSSFLSSNPIQQVAEMQLDSFHSGSFIQDFIKIPPEISNYVHFIKVIGSNNSFYDDEYMMLNFGAQHSKSDFLFFTRISSVIPEYIFETAEEHHLNTGQLYICSEASYPYHLLGVENQENSIEDLIPQLWRYKSFHIDYQPIKPQLKIIQTKEDAQYLYNLANKKHGINIIISNELFQLIGFFNEEFLSSKMLVFFGQLNTMISGSIIHILPFPVFEKQFVASVIP